MRRDLAVAFALAVLTAAFAGATAPAASATSTCAKQVIEDWRDNGKIDRRYKLTCYPEAIDALPEPIRIYTNAVQVISRAYQSVGGTRTLTGPSGPTTSPPPGPRGPDTTPPINTAATTDVPLPVYVLGAFAVVLLGAGAVSYVLRRRNRGEDGLPPA